MMIRSTIKSSMIDKSRSWKSKRKTQVNLLENKIASFLNSREVNDEQNIHRIKTITNNGGYGCKSPCPSMQTITTGSSCRTCVPCSMMPIAIHVALLIMFGGSFLYNIWWDINKNNSIFKDWIYLTHWNLTMQVFFCGIELLSDLNASFAETTAVFRAKLFHTIIFPFSLFVCTFFWTLCLIDECLVRNSNVELRYDSWYSHVVVSVIN